MPDDRRRGRTLNTRITLLVVGVATLVTVVAGVASLQLVRGALEQQAHEHLATQVGILAEEGDLETAARQAQAWAQDVGDQWAGVASDGSYGVPEGIVFGVPAVCANGDYEVVKGLPLDDFSKTKFDVTLKELLEERDGVAALLG